MREEGPESLQKKLTLTWAPPPPFPSPPPTTTSGQLRSALVNPESNHNLPLLHLPGPPYLAPHSPPSPPPHPWPAQVCQQPPLLLSLLPVRVLPSLMVIAQQVQQAVHQQDAALLQQGGAGGGQREGGGGAGVCVGGGEGGRGEQTKRRKQHSWRRGGVNPGLVTQQGRWTVDPKTLRS